MDTARLMEYLNREYGIHSWEELDEAASLIQGIDLGIFTVPYGGKIHDSQEGEEVPEDGQELRHAELRVDFCGDYRAVCADAVCV